MNSEEIKATRLCEGDILEMKIRVEVGTGSLAAGYSTPSMLMDVGDTSGTVDVEEGVRGVLSFSFPDECIVAIQRMMPGLPKGWTWALTTTEPTVIARASHTGYSEWATIDYQGRILFRGVLSALVAKALIEVWGRTQ